MNDSKKIDNNHIYSDVSEKIWSPEKYDSLRKQLIPGFDMLYSTAVDILKMTFNTNINILDLGAGTGLLSQFILDGIPSANITLLDRSISMLNKAKEIFHNNENIQYQQGQLEDNIEANRYDAIVSGLAIHHLSHEKKKALFKNIYTALKPKGVFINVEQVSAPTEMIESLYSISHENHVLSSKIPLSEWEAGKERMKIDICAETYQQIAWLNEAGFCCSDCLAKVWRFTTYAAWKTQK